MYNCDLCSCEYSHKKGLYRHKRLHHVVNGEACSECPWSFASKELRDSHLFRMHRYRHVQFNSSVNNNNFDKSDNDDENNNNNNDSAYSLDDLTLELVKNVGYSNDSSSSKGSNSSQNHHGNGKRKNKSKNPTKSIKRTRSNSLMTKIIPQEEIQLDLDVSLPREEPQEEEVKVEVVTDDNHLEQDPVGDESLEEINVTEIEGETTEEINPDKIDVEQALSEEFWSKVRRVMSAEDFDSILQVFHISPGHYDWFLNMRDKLSAFPDLLLDFVTLTQPGTREICRLFDDYPICQRQIQFMQTLQNETGGCPKIKVNVLKRLHKIHQLDRLKNQVIDEVLTSFQGVESLTSTFKQLFPSVFSFHLVPSANYNATNAADKSIALL